MKGFTLYVSKSWCYLNPTMYMVNIKEKEEQNIKRKDIRKIRQSSLMYLVVYWKLIINMFYILYYLFLFSKDLKKHICNKTKYADICMFQNKLVSYYQFIGKIKDYQIRKLLVKRDSYLG